MLFRSYQHLQIRCISRTNRADTNDFITVQFNSDTGANYAYHSLYGTGAAANGNDTGTSQTTPWSSATAGGNASASMFGASVIDILDFSNTNKYKTLRALSGTDQNSTTGRLYFMSNLWQNSNAISTIKISPTYGTSFAQYSQFALYGIRG